LSFPVEAALDKRLLVRSRRLLASTLLAIAALSLVAIACGGGGQTKAPTAEIVEIVAVAGNPGWPTFNKDTITVKAGSQVTLVFTNNEIGMPHNWAAYTDSTASKPIPGAATEVCTGPCREQITFTAPSKPGNYFFRCDVHPTIMTGTLVVQ
jgi:plastocyanin